MVLLACVVTNAWAGGMIDSLGEFETYPLELAEDTVVTVGDHDVVLQAGSGAQFYVLDGVHSGALYMGRLAEDAIVSAHGTDVTVRAPNVVWFYEDGELKYTSDLSEPQAFLAQGRPVIFGGQYDVYLPLGFHRNGQVFQGTLYEPTELTVQDGSCLFTGWVAFAEDGSLTYGVLAEDAVFTIQGADYEVSAGSDISFYADGTVKEVGLPDRPVLFRAGDRVFSFIAVPTRSSNIVFHPNGSVMHGCLAEDTVFTVDGAELTLETGTLARFNQDGTLNRE